MKVTLLAILGLITMSFHNVYASDGISANPGTIPLNGNAQIKLWIDAASTTRHVTYIAVYDPTGTLVNDSVVDSSIPLPTISGGGSYTWDLNNDLNVVPNMVGNWLVVIDTLEGTSFLIDFATSTFVLPETPIGAVAVLGSSLAALGVYIYRNR